MNRDNCSNYSSDISILGHCPVSSLSLTELNVTEDDFMEPVFRSSVDYNTDDVQGELREEFGMDLDMPFGAHSLINDTDFGIPLKPNDDLDIMLGGVGSDEIDDSYQLDTSVSRFQSSKDSRSTNDTSTDSKPSAKGTKKRSTSAKAKVTQKKYNTREKQTSARRGKKLPEPEMDSDDEDVDDDDDEDENSDDDGVDDNDEEGDESVGDSQLMSNKKSNKKKVTVETEEDSDDETLKTKSKKKQPVRRKGVKWTRAKVAKSKKPKAVAKKMKQSNSSAEDETDVSDEEEEKPEKAKGKKNTKARKAQPEPKTTRRTAGTKGKKVGNVKKKVTAETSDEDVLSSNEDEENAEEDEEVEVKQTRGGKKRGKTVGNVTTKKGKSVPKKTAGGKVKGKPMGKRATKQSSGEDERMQAQEDSESEECNTVDETANEDAVTSGEEVSPKKPTRKRPMKKNASKPKAKKAKITKVTKQVMDEVEDTEDDSSDNVPLQQMQMRQRPGKRPNAEVTKKTADDEDDDDEDEDDDETEDEDDTSDFKEENQSVRGMSDGGKNMLLSREPILSSLAMGPSVTHDDSSSVNSATAGDDGPSTRRTSARTRKPPKWSVNMQDMLTDVSQKSTGSNQAVKVSPKEKKNKKKKQGSLVADVEDTDEPQTNDIPAEEVENQLVIDTTFESVAVQPEADKPDDDDDDDTESETEIAADWKQLSKCSPVKRSERLKEHDEITQEKFKRLKRERAKHEALRKKKLLLVDESQPSASSSEIEVNKSKNVDLEASADEVEVTKEVCEEKPKLEKKKEASLEQGKMMKPVSETAEMKAKSRRSKGEKDENPVEKNDKATKVKRSEKEKKEEPAKQDKEKNEKNVQEKLPEAVADNAKSSVPASRCRGPGCVQPPSSGSIYCNELCIQKHAQESLELLERHKTLSSRSKEPGAGGESSKSLERIVMFERKTGKLVTGPAAPTELTLHSWLLRHPMFEVLQPGQQVGVANKSKKVEKKPLIKEIPAKELPKMAEYPVPSKPEVVKPRPAALLPTPDPSLTVNTDDRKTEETTARSSYRSSGRAPSGPDPARISIRNSIRETLFNRANETDDVMVSTTEIKRLALAVEEELFAYYSEVNTNYKHKFRTLITHLKDPKNKGLFRKVLFGELTPYRLVRLSSDSIGSKEYARWQEPDFKRTGITLLPSPDKPLEQKVDSRPFAEISVQPSVAYSDSNYDFLSAIIIDTTPQHGRHFFDVNCKICTGKVPDPLYDEEHKAPPIVQPPRPAQPVRPAEETHAEVSSNPIVRDFSRDPRRSKPAATSSPVAVVSKAEVVKPAPAAVVPPPPPTYPLLSPESIQQSLLASPISQSTVAEIPPFWQGTIHAQEIAKVSVSAYVVSGVLTFLTEELSDTIVITGRLPPENVYNYLSQIKGCASGNREVTVIRLQAAENDAAHAQLFSYLSVRNRCGVVSSWGSYIKDMYVLPLLARSAIPPALLPFEGPGLADNRPDVLLGVIVTHAAKPRPATVVKAPTKTWMYSERTEELSATPVDKVPKTTSAVVETNTIASPSNQEMENYSTTKSVKTIQLHKTSISMDGDSSGQSDAEESQSMSDVLKKDPIVYKYSKDPAIKKPSRNFLPLVDEDDDRPYDPFGDDDDDVLVVPPKAVIATVSQTHPMTATVSLTHPVTTVTSVVSQSQSVAVAAVSTVIPTVATSSSHSFTGVDLAQLVDHLTRTGSSPEVIATVLSTLVATSPDGGPEEQRQICQRLTEALRERQRLIDQQKTQVASTTTTSVSGLSLTSAVVTNAAPRSVQTFVGGLAVEAAGEANSPMSTIAAMNQARVHLMQKIAESGPISVSASGTSDLSMPPSSASVATLSLATATTAVAPVTSSTFQVTSTAATTASASVPLAGLTNTTGQSVPCNISLLPPSIQQMLSGQSFENLKNIVANVTGKKSGGENTPPASESSGGKSSDKASEPTVSHKDGQEKADTTNSVSAEKTFVANVHGDVDYRVMAASATKPASETNPDWAFNAIQGARAMYPNVNAMALDLNPGFRMPFPGPVGPGIHPGFGMTMPAYPMFPVAVSYPATNTGNTVTGMPPRAPRQQPLLPTPPPSTTGISDSKSMPQQNESLNRPLETEPKSSQSSSNVPPLPPPPAPPLLPLPAPRSDRQPLIQNAPVPPERVKVSGAYTQPSARAGMQDVRMSSSHNDRHRKHGHEERSSRDDSRRESFADYMRRNRVLSSGDCARAIRNQSSSSGSGAGGHDRGRNSRKNEPNVETVENIPLPPPSSSAPHANDPARSSSSASDVASTTRNSEAAAVGDRKTLLPTPGLTPEGTRKGLQSKEIKVADVPKSASVTEEAESSWKPKSDWETTSSGKRIMPHDQETSNTRKSNWLETTSVKTEQPMQKIISLLDIQRSNIKKAKGEEATNKNDVKSEENPIIIIDEKSSTAENEEVSYIKDEICVQAKTSTSENKSNASSEMQKPQKEEKGEEKVSSTVKPGDLSKNENTRSDIKEASELGKCDEKLADTLVEKSETKSEESKDLSVLKTPDSATKESSESPDIMIVEVKQGSKTSLLETPDSNMKLKGERKTLLATPQTAEVVNKERGRNRHGNVTRSGSDRNVGRDSSDSKSRQTLSRRRSRSSSRSGRQLDSLRRSSNADRHRSRSRGRDDRRRRSNSGKINVHGSDVRSRSRDRSRRSSSRGRQIDDGNRRRTDSSSNRPDRGRYRESQFSQPSSTSSNNYAPSAEEPLIGSGEMSSNSEPHPRRQLLPTPFLPRNSSDMHPGADINAMNTMDTEKNTMKHNVDQRSELNYRWNEDANVYHPVEIRDARPVHHIEEYYQKQTSRAPADNIDLAPGQMYVEEYHHRMPANSEREHRSMRPPIEEYKQTHSEHQGKVCAENEQRMRQAPLEEYFQKPADRLPNDRAGRGDFAEFGPGSQGPEQSQHGSRVLLQKQEAGRFHPYERHGDQARLHMEMDRPEAYSREENFRTDREYHRIQQQPVSVLPNDRYTGQSEPSSDRFLRNADTSKPPSSEDRTQMQYFHQGSSECVGKDNADAKRPLLGNYPGQKESPNEQASHRQTPATGEAMPARYTQDVIKPSHRQTPAMGEAMPTRYTQDVMKPDHRQTPATGEAMPVRYTQDVIKPSHRQIPATSEAMPTRYTQDVMKPGHRQTPAMSEAMSTRYTQDVIKPGMESYTTSAHRMPVDMQPTGSRDVHRAGPSMQQMASRDSGPFLLKAPPRPLLDVVPSHPVKDMSTSSDRLMERRDHEREQFAAGQCLQPEQSHEHETPTIPPLLDFSKYRGSGMQKNTCVEIRPPCGISPLLRAPNLGARMPPDMRMSLPRGPHMENMMPHPQLRGGRPPGFDNRMMGPRCQGNDLHMGMPRLRPPMGLGASPAFRPHPPRLMPPRGSPMMHPMSGLMAQPRQSASPNQTRQPSSQTKNVQSNNSPQHS